jgi:ABC-type transporter Mla subunit MlaD
MKEDLKKLEELAEQLNDWLDEFDSTVNRTPETEEIFRKVRDQLDDLNDIVADLQ